MEKNSGISVKPARTAQDLQDARELFAAYAAWLNINLDYQDFDTEMKSLPGKYAPPKGEILLARDLNNKAVGCVAVRPLGLQGVYCEMKRLYTIPEGRGHGIGHTLVHDIIDVAVNIGYSEMRLNTLDSMAQAISLYRKFGFVSTDAYYYTPVEKTVFLAKRLS